MTSFLVGIIVLIVATLAVSRSLVSDRADERGGSDGDYVDEADEYEYVKPVESSEPSPFDDDALPDEFALDPDSEAEDRRLNGVWDD